MEAKKIFLTEWAFAKLDELVDEAPSSCRLMLWLIRHMGRTGELQASCAHIARELGLSERTVRRAIADLRDRGLITTVRTAGGGCLHYVVDPRVARTAYRGRRAAGAEGAPAWRADADPWRLTREERQTIAYVPDTAAGSAEEE